MKLFLFAAFMYVVAASSDIYSVLSLTPAMSNYVSTKSEIENVDSALDTLRGQYKNLRTSAYTNNYLKNPVARPVPHSADVINQIANNMKKLRKSMLKEQEAPEGSSPEEMMLFQQLMSGLKRSSRKKDEEPAMHAASQVELDAIQNLANQIHMVSNSLESPEENALHDHAHAQSRMLHRMTHVLDAMSGEMDSERQRHYEDMLTTLMHQHLADPDYRDTLHDHLLAHHLSRSHQDDEFVDHVSHNMLYNNLNRRVAPDTDYSASLGAVLSGSLGSRNHQTAVSNAQTLGSYVDAYQAKDAQSAAMFNKALAEHTNNQYAQARPAAAAPAQVAVAAPAK